MPGPLITPRDHSTRSSVINMRVRESDRALIDRAAETVGRSRSDFIMDVARKAAQDALLNRTVVRANRDTFDEFLAMLDSPPQVIPGLAELMRLKAPWG